MKKVTGQFSFNIYSECPNEDCREVLDLQKIEGEDEPQIGRVILGSPTRPGKWSEIGIVLKCPHCKTNFELHDLEY